MVERGNAECSIKRAFITIVVELTLYLRSARNRASHSLYMTWAKLSLSFRLLLIDCDDSIYMPRCCSTKLASSPFLHLSLSLFAIIWIKRHFSLGQTISAAIVSPFSLLIWGCVNCDESGTDCTHKMTTLTFVHQFWWKTFRHV